MHWCNVDSYSSNGSIILIEKCQGETNHTLNPCEACIAWSDIRSINMASHSAHLPVTPCSCESYRHNRRALQEHNCLLHYVYITAALTWLNSLHPDRERSQWASLQHQDVLYTLRDMERIKEERAAGWGGRERSLWEAGCEHMPNSVSGSLSLPLIPSLIHRHSGQSFEAGRNPWSPSPNLSLRPRPQSTSDSIGRLPAEEWQA